MNKFEYLAQDIFFRGGGIDELLNIRNLQLKSGKSHVDVIKAFNFGMEKGSGKFEREMMECGIAFKSILEEKP